MSDSYEEYHDASSLTTENLQKMAVMINVLGAYARAYSESYAEGEEDACRAGIGHDDRGCYVETDISFHAQRERVVVPDDEGLTEEHIETFTIVSRIAKTKLAYKTIPPALIEMAIAVDDYEPDALAESGVEYGVAYGQQFQITSTGKFVFEYGLSFCIDGNELDLPADVLTEALSQSSAWSAPLEDDMFAGIFSKEELASIQKDIEEAEYDTDAETALRLFSEQLPPVRLASTAQRYDMAVRTAQQIFGVDRKD